MVVRSYYNPAQSEQQLTDFRQVMTSLKPAVTVMTGLFSCCVHGYVHNMVREENFFILSCVTCLSLGLSGMEMFWELQVKCGVRGCSELIKIFAGSDGSIVLLSLLAPVILHCPALWTCR